MISDDLIHSLYYQVSVVANVQQSYFSVFTERDHKGWSVCISEKRLVPLLFGAVLLEVSVKDKIVAEK